MKEQSHKFIWLELGALLALVALVLLWVPTPHSTAQAPQDNRQLNRDQAQQSNRASERRIALVIGNGAYTSAPPLKNPPNDARDMAATLRALGFDVTSGINANQRDMKRLIREFGQKLKAGGSGLFYYAGHGVQSKGRNYLIPVEADIQSEAEVEDAGVDVNLVLNYMDDAQNSLNIVILDACRNNPFGRSFRSATNGLAQMSAPTGTLIAYATAPGSVASDGDERNGLYTSELLKQMKEPGIPIEIVFKRVGTRVSAATSGRQEPWIALSLRGDFYFVAGTHTSAEKASSLSTSLPIASNQPPSATGPAGGSSSNYQDANAIASKDIGSLRVVLKSILPIRLSQYGRSVNGIRCAFKFINLETQRPIVVAMNAIAPDVNNLSIGSYLRSTLVDENGGLWRPRNSDVAGMTVVGVGQQRYDGPYYNPAEIVLALSKRDDINSDDIKPDRGGTYGPREGGYRFIFGSTTEMSPGQSLTVTMTFVQDANETTSGAPPKVFQFASEIVVGIVRTGTRNSYSLHNLMFDRVSITAGAS